MGLRPLSRDISSGFSDSLFFPSALFNSLVRRAEAARNNGCRHTDQDRNVKPGNIPRISRLTALAIRFEGLVRRGEVRDYADLARLGCVTQGEACYPTAASGLLKDTESASTSSIPSPKACSATRETTAAAISSTL